jgi:TonB family protein
MGIKKILIIDYDQSSMAALHQTLVKEGFEVSLACDGKSGWDKFEEEHPDLVLMEAMLSKIHGFELCERITKNPRRKVPVFIMTAVYKDRIYRTEALRTYGATEYFEKPVDMPSFLAAVHGVLTVPDIKPAKSETIRIETVAGVGPVNGGNSTREVPKIPVPTLAPAQPKTETAPVPNLPKGSILSAKPAAEVITPKVEPTKVKMPLPISLFPVGKPKELKKKMDTEEDAEKAEIDRLLRSALEELDLHSHKKPAPAKPKAAPLPPLPDLILEKLKPVLPVQKSPLPKAAVPSAPAAKPVPVKPAPVPPAQVQPAPRPVPRPAPKPAQPPKPAPAFSPKPLSSPPHPVAAPKPIEAVKKDVPPPPEKPSPLHLPFREPEPPPAAGPKTDATPRMFKDMYEVKRSRPMSPVVGIALLIFIIVVGILLLTRPKPGVSPSTGLNAASMPVEQKPADMMPVNPPDPKPVVKSQGGNAKPKGGNRAGQGNGAAALPSAEDAILDLKMNEAPKIILPGEAEQKAGGATTNPPVQAPPTKPEETSGQASGAQVSNEKPATTTGPGSGPAVQPAITPKTSAGDLLPLEAVDEQPKLLKRVEPVYPTLAQRAKLEGSITVNALINESGSVSSTGILKGMKDDKGLEKAAEAAVRKWKFQPAKKDGVNVKVWMAIVVTFKSGDGGSE